MILREKLEGDFVVTRLLGIPIFRWSPSPDMVAMFNHFLKWEEYKGSDNYYKAGEIHDKILEESLKESKRIELSQTEYDILQEYEDNISCGIRKKLDMLFGVKLSIGEGK